MTKLWFKAKKYGWGWYPGSWEGWAVTSAYTIFTIGASILFAHRFEKYHSKSDIAWLIISNIVLTIAFIIICYTKGEKPSWRWGDKEH